jgi:RimJ/RimL family protein N-acetyltransferase
MRFIFFAPNADDVESIYESYRLDCEPDSPTHPFVDICLAEKEKLIQGSERFFQVVVRNGQKVGWITVIDRDSDPEIKVGFGLFREFRGKKLMAQIVHCAAKNIIAKGTNKRITAGARMENIAAIKTLERAGFVQERAIERSPLGKWPTPIIYTYHVFAPPSR